MNNALRGLSCRYCDEAFKRKEHLDRHLRRHLGSKPFKCNFCSKAFSRKDVLSRHQITHEQTSSGSSSPRRPGKKPPACLACSKAKQRCSKGSPCRSCEDRGVDCFYPSDGAAAGRNPIGQHDESPAATDGEAAFATRLPQSVDSDMTMIAGSLDGSQTSPVTDILSIPPHLDAISPSARHGYPEPPGPGAYFDSFNPFAIDAGFSLNSISLPWMYNYVDLAQGLPRPALTSSGANGEARNYEQDGLAGGGNDPISIASSNRYESPIPSHSVFSTSQTPTFFPSLQPNDENVLLAEDFCHVSEVNQLAYDQLVGFFKTQNRPSPEVFPELRVVHTFVQLYYEHFDAQFPCIHPTLLGSGDDSWIALLATAAIGSQYSSISNAEQYSTALQELLHQALEAYKPEPDQIASLQFAQGMLLSMMCLQFSGTQKGSMKAQWDRSQLLSICRSIVGFPRHDGEVWVSVHDKEWRTWLSAESRVRLIHSLFKFQCLQLIFMGLPPVFKLHELTDRFPTDDSLWRCRDSASWRDQCRSPQVTGPGLVGLDLCNEKNAASRMSSFAQEMYMLSLHAEEEFVRYQLSCPLWRFLAKGSPHTPTAVRNNNSLTETFLSIAADSVSDAFESLKTEVVSSKEGTDQSCLMRQYHVLSILRKISLRKLYEFSGWQVTEAQIEASRDYLRCWMGNNQRMARRCLWHAAAAFKILRSKHYLGCDDPFALLIAVLYIWAFDQLAETTGSDVPSPGSALDHRPTRIDMLREPRDIDTWVEKGSSGVHITGIGALKSPRSGARLIAENQRVLSTSKGWPSLRNFLTGAWERVAEGGRPHGWLGD